MGRATHGARGNGRSAGFLFLLATGLALLILACPAQPLRTPDNPEPGQTDTGQDDLDDADDAPRSYPLASFLPIAVGNRWEWVLEPAVGEGETPVLMSFSIEAECPGYPARVWRTAIEAPDFFMLAFSLMGCNGTGYLVELEDGYFFAKSADLLDGLPDSSGLTRIALEPDLGPQVVRTEWNGDTFWVSYEHGSVLSLLPPDTHPDYFGRSIDLQVASVGLSTSNYGLLWSNTKLILGEDTGPVFVRTRVGDLYLQVFSGEPVQLY